MTSNPIDYAHYTTERVEWTELYGEKIGIFYWVVKKLFTISLYLAYKYDIFTVFLPPKPQKMKISTVLNHILKKNRVKKAFFVKKLDYQKNVVFLRKKPKKRISLEKVPKIISLCVKIPF